jgi:hypothetical protein
MHDALQFVKFSKDEMGVEIFMMAGWQDDRGEIKKTKWISLSLK